MYCLTRDHQIILVGEFRVAPYYECHVVSFWVQMTDIGDLLGNLKYLAVGRGH